MVSTVVEYFTRKGNPVFGASMDMSKAFDMVKWTELFNILLERRLSPIIVRLLLYIYCSQRCTVKWGSCTAEHFSVSNGVRQGGVSSGIFFVVYIDKLLTLLRKSGLGCTLHNVFLGATIYADDIFLLSASRYGLQAMVQICEQFGSTINLKFGTNENPVKSKTKCIMFTQSRRIITEVKQIQLGGNRLPWVNQVKHLGHTLQSDNSKNIDMSIKRGRFIAKVNALLEEFHYAAPDVVMKLLQTYACNIYGSNTWDLFSRECQKVYTNYNVAVRNMLKLPRTTHRYLLEPLTESPHLFTQLVSRYVTFVSSLLCSNAFEVRFLVRLCMNDQRTVLGRTMTRIALLCNARPDDISSNMVKKSVKYAPIPEAEVWRIGVVQNMCSIRDRTIPDHGLTDTEAAEILDFACTS